MKIKPSDSTERLIESLYTRKTLWDRLVKTDQPDEVIRLIEEAGEPAAIPDLLPILLIGDGKSVLASARAIHHLLQTIKPADFAHFDEFVRQGYSDWQARREPWYLMKPEDVSHVASMGDMSVSLLGIASCHANGRVREAAVRELSNSETGAELPFLLMRVNDWVPQVRSAARDLVMHRIRLDYAQHVSVWLSLVLRLRYAGRDDHSTIIRAVSALLASPEAGAVLQEGLKSQDQFVRRFCFQLALNSKVGGDLVLILRRAIGNSDPYVRKEAVQKLSAILPGTESKELLVRARNDGYMPVRREALRIFVAMYANEAEREFEFALLDSNAGVREEARYYFKRKTEIDLLAYYSRKLDTSDNRELCAAIAGVGETGRAKGSQLVERFFQNASSKVRAAAIRTAAKLNPEAYLGTFVLGLCDTSSKVAREARLALAKKPNSAGGQRLWDIYQKCPHLHGQRSALFLIARINKWDSINFLIRSLTSRSDSCVDLSRAYIARWFARYNRSFVSPTPEQLLRLKHTLNQCNLLLSSGTQREIDYLLKSF
jgi:HEAT repeat protein